MSEENSDKISEILSRIGCIFAREGFDGASMQQLAKAADMSVGNFYRYFSSKDDIIRAIVDANLQHMEADFQKVANASNHAEALYGLIRNRVMSTCREEAALWAEIQAAGFRSPFIRDLSVRMETKVKSYLLALMENIKPSQSPDNLSEMELRADMLILVVKALAMKQASLKSPGNGAGHNPALVDFAIRGAIGNFLSGSGAMPGSSNDIASEEIFDRNIHNSTTKVLEKPNAN